MQNIRVTEQAQGVAYTLGDTTIIFPFGNWNPRLPFGESYVTVDMPERFGQWDNHKNRCAWIRAFVAARKTAS